jgi:hypothetical protein
MTVDNNTKETLYAYSLKKGRINVGSTLSFVLPDNLGYDKYDITISYRSDSNGSPTLGNVILKRNDVDKDGETFDSVESFQTFLALSQVITIGETNVLFKVSNVTPNSFEIKNTLDIPIFARVSIDVLDQPFSRRQR